MNRFRTPEYTSVALNDVRVNFGDAMEGTALGGARPSKLEQAESKARRDAFDFEAKPGGTWWDLRIAIST
jgi:hypothetical protein